MNAELAKLRTEKDAIGQCDLPEDALFGINTFRSVNNFAYVGERLRDYPNYVSWLIKIKWAAAITNGAHGKISTSKTDAIVAACKDIVADQAYEPFVVDMLEGAGGTSINMNINEVLANRALQLQGKCPGDYHLISPLDDVNHAQSTSDVLIAAMKLTLHDEIAQLVATLRMYSETFREQEARFDKILRIGRTCMQDALPVRVGQAFGGYAELVDRSASNLEGLQKSLNSLPLGATAIGTGLGAYPGYTDMVLSILRDFSNQPLVADKNFFDGIQNLDEFATLSAAVKTTGLAISKIANDFILLSSGPVGGLQEIRLEAKQTGSSMMPGKVNPVFAMGMVQAAFLVSGLDASIAPAVAAGQLDCNNYLPLIAYSSFKSIKILNSALNGFHENCVKTLEVLADQCESNLMRSTAVAPALKARIGYERTAELVNIAHSTGRTLMELVVERGLMSEGEVFCLLHRACSNK
ncbi:lyase family protein [Pseudomonas prosekii]|uniref:lyase family protein n=1 Tax=Pseudomonas prosekii TaxID=1148509 RepID=UPI0011EA813C|nr:lyase family protein [Pseudomonas prosekii]